MISEVVRSQSLLAQLQVIATSEFEDDDAWLSRARIAVTIEKESSAAARSMDMSHQALCKRFARLAGISPRKYRTATIMERACELVSGRTRTIKQISEELDYCIEYHFSKQFAKTSGLPLSDYRSRIANTS